MVRFLVFSLIYLLFLTTTSAQAKSLNLCTHKGFEPFVIINSQQVSGIDIDVIYALFKKYQQDYNLKVYPWQRLIEGLKSGDCDMAFSLFDTEERREFANYIFTIPLHYSTFNVFTLKDKTFPFTQVKDLFGKTIAHNRGFSLTVSLDGAIKQGLIKRREFDNPSTAVKLLLSKRADAIIDNEHRFRYYLKKHGKNTQIRALGAPFFPHRPAFLVLSRKSKIKDPLQLKQKLETGLKELYLDGTINKITQSYIN